jgi:TRAP-type C4-dicarboxylate transport system substrate-binding protein
MVPTLMPINEVTDAISRDAIDGATVPPGALFEFGIARVAHNHFLLRLGGAPLLLLMNKRKFESLPPQARDLLRKFRGEWIATRYSDAYEKQTESALEQITTNPRRVVVEPSPREIATAQEAFVAVIAAWRKQGPREQELYAALEREIARARLPRADATPAPSQRLQSGGIESR